MTVDDMACPACHSAAVTIASDGRRRCVNCDTIWIPSRRDYVYGDDYPAEQGHHDAAMARCKRVTLSGWIRRLRIPLAGRRVLEVGFGSGATLGWLQQQGAATFGQEPVAANRADALKWGIPEQNIKAGLAEFSGEPFDLALYLDVFEHVADPAAHLALLGGVTARGSQALLVLPVADCRSRALLGRWWPLDSEDHWIFYSRAGLTTLWGKFGWRMVTQFYPWKFVSALTFARYWQTRTGLPLPLGPLALNGVWLNFGERGFLLERL